MTEHGHTDAILQRISSNYYKLNQIALSNPENPVKTPEKTSFLTAHNRPEHPLWSILMPLFYPSDHLRQQNPLTLWPSASPRPAGEHPEVCHRKPVPFSAKRIFTGSDKLGFEITLLSKETARVVEMSSPR